MLRRSAAERDGVCRWGIVQRQDPGFWCRLRGFESLCPSHACEPSYLLGGSVFSCAYQGFEPARARSRANARAFAAERARRRSRRSEWRRGAAPESLCPSHACEPSYLLGGSVFSYLCMQRKTLNRVGLSEHLSPKRNKSPGIAGQARVNGTACAPLELRAHICRELLARSRTFALSKFNL